MGDLMTIGGNIEVNAPVGGDAALAGGTLRMNGSIAQSLYAAGGQLTINGAVGRNARVAGGLIEFGLLSNVAGNVSIGGGHVITRGQIKGSLLAAGGKVLIDGAVAVDVEAHSGQVELGPNARIAGKLRYASREELKRGPAAQVQGAVERVDLAGGWPVPEDVEHGMGRRGGWIWAIGLLIVAGVLVAALPAFYARVTETVRTRFGMSVLLGFGVLVCIPVAAMLFFFTIIGAAALGVLIVGLLARIRWLGG
jgi:cytoskeletal protein CcmA (bactofilin family)